MKFITPKKLFQYFLPTSFTLFMMLTIERSVDTDIGGYAKLYGLPFPFISSNYAFTHHFDVYLLMMLFDLLFYFIVTLLFFKGLESIGLNLKTHWTFIVISTLIILFWVFTFYATTFESTFKLTNDFSYKVTDRQFHFGTIHDRSTAHNMCICKSVALPAALGLQ